MLADATPDGLDETVVEAVGAAADTVVDVAQLAAGLAVGGLVGLAFTLLVFRTVFRVWRTPFGLEARAGGALWRRLTGVALGALAGLRVVRDVAGELADLLAQALVLTIIVGLCGIAVRLLQAAEQAAIQTYDTADADDLLARRRRTQFLVMRRVGSALVGIVGLSLALLTFPQARSVGTSLLASAGLIGVVAGVAAQGALKNLFAGIQIAAAEPLQLDDAVLVEGEWGFIEDITVTTVVVRTWDRRRLIYPSAWFIEHPFQNWTRTDAQLIGSVELVLDHRADVSAIRVEAERLVTTNDKWDGDVVVVQLIDADATGITVRVLMTAHDAPTTYELRCDVREALVAWIVANDPDALPVRRLLPADGAGPADG